MRLPDFEAWAMFAAVVEHRSFTAAAKALGLSKATVSKAISRLESSIGATLFHRTSRRLSLTETGLRLSERAARILAEAVAAEEAAHDEASSPKGTIRLAAPMSFGLLHVAPAVADFLEQYPAITIDLHLSDEKIDIIELGFDIVLRIALLPDSSLRVRRLEGIKSHILASPSYLAQRGRPTHPAQLSQHACLVYAYNDAPDIWRFLGPDREEVAIRPAGSLRSNSGDAMLPALCAGLGIAILPDFIVRPHLEAGRLETILEEWSPPPMSLHLLTPPGDPRPVRVELLADFLAGRFRAICSGQ